MNKKIKKIGLLSLMSLALISGVSAQEALSIGTDFGSGLNSTQEAIYAANSYGSLGYHSFIDSVPTVSSLNSEINQYNIASNTAGALFFHGHGAKEYIGWDYLGKGGTYSTGFIQDGVGSVTNYKKISSLNLNKTKIAIFMGCNTAQTTNNISKYAQTKGAKVTTGWVYEIFEGETDKWNEAFFSKLKSGKTFRESYKYANSLKYAHNENMKTHRVYGDATVKGAASTAKTATINETSEEDIDNRRKVEVKIKNRGAIDELINQYIQSELDNNFDVNDYEIEITDGPDGGIYDYNYVLDGIPTEYGYTAFVENGMLEIYDNMGEFASVIAEKSNYPKAINEQETKDQKDLDEYVQKILLKYSNLYKEYNVSIHSTKKIYDAKLNKVVLNIYIKVQHKITGATSIYTETL